MNHTEEIEALRMETKALRAMVDELSKRVEEDDNFFVKRTDRAMDEIYELHHRIGAVVYTMSADTRKAYFAHLDKMKAIFDRRRPGEDGIDNPASGQD